MHPETSEISDEAHGGHKGSDSNGRDELLGTLGERSILTNILIPRLAGSNAGSQAIGDDCAELLSPDPGYAFLATTDPCPTPVVFDLEDRDYWHYGRMTILINVSDLAAMGAVPQGILISTVMPNEMRVADYQRYLDGLIEAAAEWGCPIVGGNIKDGPEFTSTGTAFGTAPVTNIMRRTGARVGDVVCVAGRMGLFWAAVLQRLSHRDLRISPQSSADLKEALYRPIARLKEGLILADSGLVTACMDSSDGVGACLVELADKNCVDVTLDVDGLIPEQSVREVADELAIDPRKLLLAWGNWELVFTVAPDNLDALVDLAVSHDLPIAQIGRLSEGEGHVWLTEGLRRRPVNNFASERFTSLSYFTHGLKSYMQWLIEAPLTSEE